MLYSLYSKLPLIVIAGAGLTMAQTPQSQTNTGQNQTGGGQQSQTGQTGQSGPRGQTGGARSQTETTTGQGTASQRTDAPRDRSGASTSAATAGSPSNMSDAQFVSEALDGGRHEVEMGRMALNQASDSKLKSFAQRLVNDHSNANQKLEALAKKNNISTSETSSTAKSGTQTATNRSQTDTTTSRDRSADAGHDLMNLKGADFDRAFIRQMISDHEKDIQKFETEERQATNPDVKKFVSSTLPTLRQHLQQARDVEKGLKK